MHSLDHKLQYHGVSKQHQIKLLYKFAQNGEQLDHIKSTSQKSVAGVPQCLILCPLLFIIYICKKY